MPAEKPILGFRRGELISPVYDRKNINYLLTQEPTRRPTDIDGVRRDVITAVGAEISADFLLGSGLADMQWEQIYHPHALSGIYLGSNISQEAIQPSAAEAIIALHAAIVNGKIAVHFFQIAMTLLDSQGDRRVFVTMYNPFTYLANETYISVADTEEPKLGERHHPDYRNALHARINRIPTIDPHMYYREPMPLVSPAMVAVTGHTKMLRATLNEERIETMSFDHWGMEENGFFEKLNTGDNRNIGRRDPRGWEIVYPASLVASSG